MKGALAAAALLPFLALAGCANGDQTMADKVAAAEAAATRAEAAQHAAEKAALAATSAHPAPAPEPTVMADTPSEVDNGDNGDVQSDLNHGEDGLPPGGAG